jgi:hypothetical protein
LAGECCVTHPSRGGPGDLRPAGHPPGPAALQVGRLHLAYSIRGYAGCSPPPLATSPPGSVASAA